MTDQLAQVLTGMLLMFALIATAMTGVAVKRDLWDPHHKAISKPAPTPSGPTNRRAA